MKKHPYTVLLMYPLYTLESGGPPCETYLAHVHAINHVQAVIKAKEICMDQCAEIQEAEDLYPLFCCDKFQHSHF